MLKSRCLTMVTMLVLGLAPLATAEEGPGPITWLSFETTKSGKSRDLIGATIKEDGPMYDELLANGTLTSWGIAIPIAHNAKRDHMNYMLWATMDGWSRVGELEAGFMKLFASRTPEQMAEGQKLYDEATVDGSHHDVIIRHHVHEVPAPGEGTPPKYFHISYWKTAPQGYDAMTEFYKDNIAPIMAPLQASGAVASYGISTQELHADPSWTHVTWYLVSDLEAIDTVSQALDAGLDKDAVAEIMPMMDWEGHWDQVLMIVHMGGMPTEE